MTKLVEVTLKISVPVDAEYSPAEHADDIVSTAKRIFSAADIEVVDISSGENSAIRDPARVTG